MYVLNNETFHVYEKLRIIPFFIDILSYAIFTNLHTLYLTHAMATLRSAGYFPEIIAEIVQYEFLVSRNHYIY